MVVILEVVVSDYFVDGGRYVGGVVHFFIFPYCRPELLLYIADAVETISINSIVVIVVLEHLVDRKGERTKGLGALCRC